MYYYELKTYQNMKNFMNNNPYKRIIIEGECKRTKYHRPSYWPGQK